jgi:AraC-like DNA-binding protein
MMTIQTTPGRLLWPAAMIVWGPGFASAGHRHHCIQLVMVLEGRLSIRNRPEDPWTLCGAALVKPDAPHEVDARGSTVLITFIDVETELGAALSQEIHGDISIVEPDRVAHWRSVLGSNLTESRVERWARAALLNRRGAVKIHPRVRRVLKYLRQNLGGSDEFSLRSLAAISGLSPSRFMHVFTESVGVPLRPYILWLRLQQAACELMNGYTATEAAYSAGFSDAAHLTRTFRRMLGTTPTEIAFRNKRSRGVSADPN